MKRDIEEILAKAADGDDEAFRALHDAFDEFATARIRKVLSSNDDAAVRDVAQDVWQDVHRSLSAYDSAIASFTRWLSIICIRRALNFERRERVRHEAVRKYYSHTEATKSAAPQNPANKLERSELIRAVRDCARLLQGREREIFAAVRFSTLSVSNVAARHGITAGRVRGALCDANRKVLDCLRGKGLA